MFERDSILHVSALVVCRNHKMALALGETIRLMG